MIIGSHTLHGYLTNLNKIYKRSMKYLELQYFVFSYSQSSIDVVLQ